jgi:hypothetical protein
VPDPPPSDAGKPPSPPGGRQLLRVLQFLESAGYSAPAAEAVEAAVPQPELPHFAARYAPGVPPQAEPIEGTPAPAAEIAEANIDAVESLAQAAAPGPATWTSLGPTTIPDGQTYGSKRINVSGRVSALAVDPQNPSHVLAGAGHGGVWESHDRGQSWAPRTDDAKTLTTGALAFDPSAPATVYCGTGEGRVSWVVGAGLLRSTDGGRTWSPHGGATFNGQGFYDLQVDRTNSSLLSAATTHGLWLSTNGGSAWTRKRTTMTWSVSIAPGGGSAEMLAAGVEGLLRSSDGGTTWVPVALPNPPGTYKRLAVAIAPSNPEVAYAWGSDGETAFLWRRRGGVWRPAPVPPGVKVGQSWYDWFLAVAPDRDGQIFCGAIDVHRGDISGTSLGWTNISTRRGAGDSIHPDQHAIAFDRANPNTIYVGNDGGVFRSPDRGTTWQHCNNGLVITEFEYLAQDLSAPKMVIGGTQDNGTIRWTGNPVWTHIQDGDGGDCAVNNTTPSTMFHTFYGLGFPKGHLLEGNPPESSTKRGDFDTWQPMPLPLAADDDSLFYPPLDCSASGGNTIAVAGTALFVSRDNGAHWKRLAFPNPATASAMYIPTTDAVYVGTTEGAILRSTWNGTSWGAPALLGTPRAAWVSDLHADPSATRLWATYSTVGGPLVFQSQDGGATWKNRTANLRDVPINAVAVDPDQPSRLWLAADVGVHESTDGGGSWHSISDGLPNASAGDIVFHRTEKVLRVGTRSRGLWQRPTDAAPVG